MKVYGLSLDGLTDLDLLFKTKKQAEFAKNDLNFIETGEKAEVLEFELIRVKK